MIEKNTLTESIVQSLREWPQNLSVWAVDYDYTYIFFNNSHKILMKQFWAAEIELGESIFTYIDDPDYKRTVKKQYEKIKKGQDGSSLDELVDADGNTRYFENYGNTMYDADGKVIGILLHALEVTDRIKAEKELEQISTTDKLSGLFNRTKVELELSHELERARRYNRHFSLILMDFPGETADTKVIAAIGTVLKEQSRHVDSVGRIGDKEFLLVCPETNAVQAGLMADKIRGRIETNPILQEHHITCSFGIVPYRDEETIPELITNVETALLQAQK